MGVPKFFRWLSERYPKILQRVHREHASHYPHASQRGEEGVEEETKDGGEPARHDASTRELNEGSAAAWEDPLGTCGLVPPIDHLYVDVNGILHGCSHNGIRYGVEDHINEDISVEQVVDNVCTYLDRIMEIANPSSLVYLAMDGVAPRAKLNQQRSRRYRAGTVGVDDEGLEEVSVYEQYKQQQQSQKMAASGAGIPNSKVDPSLLSDPLRLVEGRWIGKAQEEAPPTPPPRRQHYHEQAHVGDQLTAGSVASGGNKSGSDGEGEGAAGPTGTKAEPEDTSSTSTRVFHSNDITPGTLFFQELVARLEDCLVRDLVPKWTERQKRQLAQQRQQQTQHKPPTNDISPLQVIVSGPNVPGEGEHKIMQFIRERQSSGGTGSESGSSYYSRVRPCLVGQDGDLILLGLATHIPHLLLLREKVWFGRAERKIWGTGPASYVSNPCFEFLHFGVLRDYLAMELEVLPPPPPRSPSSSAPTNHAWDLERTIDDVVFLSFFVGNDFLPHLPAMDIGDEGLDFLLAAYCEERHKWIDDHKINASFSEKDANDGPYLTRAGRIVSASRLEGFLSVLGSHERNYHAYKRSTVNLDRQRKYEAKFDQILRTPSDDVLHAKEQDDRKRYREMLEVASKRSSSATGGATPLVMPGLAPSDDDSRNAPSHEFFEPVVSNVQSFSERMSCLLKLSVATSGGARGCEAAPAGESGTTNRIESPRSDVDDQDIKGRYYFEKFGFSPFDADKHLALRKAYLEGLVWNLQYYYQGCVSWEWYYPYHYGPMMSDLVGLEDLLSQIKFEIGQPLRPFEQLLACLPPSHSHLLPEPYRPLFEEGSPICDFYPRSFTVDMNGKRLPWEAVVLLPFIDSSRLLEASGIVDVATLSAIEQERNQPGQVSVLICNDDDPMICSTDSDNGSKSLSRVVPFEESEWNARFDNEKNPHCFQPVVPSDTPVPLPGLATIRDGSVVSLWRKMLRINVHGMRSRYKTACLELQNAVPEIVPIEVIASELIGSVVYINYPHLVEAFVTAASDSRVILRGKDQPYLWNSQESLSRRSRMTRIISRYVFGEGQVGTGGLVLSHQGGTPMEELDILLHVRPLQGIEPTKSGILTKRFAKFEVEVPLFVTSWTPINPDKRLLDVPVLLERDPYHAARSIEANLALARTASLKRRPKSRSRSSMASEISLEPLGGPFKASSRGFCSMSGSYERRLLTYSTPIIPNYCLLNSSRPEISRAMRETTFCCHAFGQLANQKSQFTRMRATRLGRIAKLCLLAAGALFANAVSGASNFDRGSMHTHNGSPCVRSQTPDEVNFPRQRLPGNPVPTAPLKFAHGTTTVAFAFRDGIVVAVDSRASLGNFVGSKTTHKVLPIHSHLIGTMAGGAADCSFWIRKLQAEALFHEQSEGGRRMSVARASRLLANALYASRGLGLSVGTMICGFDDADESKRHTALPKIYYVDNTGMRIEGDLFAVGSGSTYALGILDSEQARRLEMTVDEAVALGIRAIRHATYRDAHSGGFINVYVITSKYGWRQVYSEDLATLTPHEDEVM